MEYASEIDTSVLSLWISSALRERLKTIKSQSRGPEPYSVSHLLDLRKDEMWTVARKQWNRVVGILGDGEGYPATKALQENVQAEWKEQRKEIMRQTRIMEGAQEQFSIEDAERTLFAISLRLAVLDTAIHVFEVYAEACKWDGWKEGPEWDKSKSFFHYLEAIYEAVHCGDVLDTDTSIFRKAEELNSIYKQNTIGRRMREDFKRYFNCAKPHGMDEWEAFFASKRFTKAAPAALLRKSDSGE